MSQRRIAVEGRRTLLRARRGWLAAVPLSALLAAPLTAAPLAPAATASCRDPWMTQAIQEVAGRLPHGGGDAGECDLRLYGARWGSFEELREQVAVTFRALHAAGLEHDGDGASIRDRAGKRAVPVSSVYVGPRRRAPQRQVNIALPRDHVLAFDWPAHQGRNNPSAADSGEAVPPSHEEHRR